MRTEDDAAVIADSLDEPERFEVVLERHFARLLEYLSRRVGREVASDLIADTFEQAFRSRARFVNANGSALPWLYGIAGLTRPLREVLLLHAWGELSNDEIAVALGVTPEAVRTRLHRARKRVAAHVGLVDSAPARAETQTHRHTEAI